MKGKVVPSYTLGLKGGFRCQDCYREYNNYIPPSGDVDKGINPPVEFCPICSSLDKIPTPKITQEQIILKKEEIVKHMVSPRRCGGLYYYESKGFYKSGYHFVPEDIYVVREKSDKWLENHDHEDCEMLWRKLMRSNRTDLI